MNNVADFLRARITERRTLAEAASHDSRGQWTQEDPDRYPGRIVDDHGDTVVYDEGSPSQEQGAHIAANDPADVIADCDAKIALVDLAVETLRCAEGDSEVDHYGALDLADRTLYLLAQPFAGHPDHKGEEWAP